MPEVRPLPEGAKPVDAPCPVCASTTLHIVQKLVATPMGTYSLAGAQVKVLARPGIVLECRTCGASTVGRVEPGGTHAVFNPEDMKVR
jgi:hypothetical protein